MGLYKRCIVFLDKVYNFPDHTEALIILSVDGNLESKGGAVYNYKILIIKYRGQEENIFHFSQKKNKKCFKTNVLTFVRYFV